MIATNGVRLRTVVEGDGPLVVLLHGWPQCWYLWRHQIDPLKKAGYRVAVPDQRGVGGSDCPPGDRCFSIGAVNWQASVRWNCRPIARVLPCQRITALGTHSM